MLWYVTAVPNNTTYHPHSRSSVGSVNQVDLVHYAAAWSCVSEVIDDWSNLNRQDAESDGD